jgi:hypothetical protein
MIRALNMMLAFTCAVALIGVYGLKYSVEETAAEKLALERQIERQEGQLSLLKADWAYLNQPSHVAPIVERHAEVLGLVPVSPQQFASFEDIPMRPVVETDAEALDSLFEALEAGFDPLEQLIEAN